MTNKMPEVGREYKLRKGKMLSPGEFGPTYTLIEGSVIDHGCYWLGREGNVFRYEGYFWDYFEELPATKEKPVVKEYVSVDTSNRVFTDFRKDSKGLPCYICKGQRGLEVMAMTEKGMAHLSCFEKKNELLEEIMSPETTKKILDSMDKPNLQKTEEKPKLICSVCGKEIETILFLTEEEGYCHISCSKTSIPGIKITEESMEIIQNTEEVMRWPENIGWVSNNNINLQKTEEVQLTLKDNASCCNNKGETEIGKEVRKAMEELRNEFTLQDYCNANKSPSDWTDVMNICREARNLLDALDKQDAESQYFCGNNHELPQNDLFSACKKCEGKFPDQEILSEKTQENAKNLPSGKSLWKSVNELRPGHDVIVKYQDESCKLHKTIAWQSEDPRGGIWFKHGEYAKSKPPEDAVFITLTDYINNIEERLRKLEGRTK